MTPKHIIHLLSGGLDSTTLLYELVSDSERNSVHCVLFDYGQKHVQELTFAKLHCHRMKVLFTVMRVPDLGGLKKDSWVVPARNMVLLSCAVNLAIQANAEAVTIGCNADDAAGFYDCTRAFIDMFNRLLLAQGIQVEVCAPYLDWPKWKIAGLARDLGVPSHEIWTCYKGGAKPCGECPACVKLKAALEH